jgi:hypothetical protein
MLVTSLSKMEEIVAGHPDLSWNGWDVVRRKQNSNAQFDPKGICVNGVWYKQYVYPITESGWSLPESLVR